MDVRRWCRVVGARAAGRLLLVALAAGVCVLGWTSGPARAEGPSWTWPLAGPPPVARPFAPPPSPYAPGHRGVDLGATPGAPVLAAGAGRVSYAGLLAGRGVVVVVHGDLRTTYEPVAPEVAVGDDVGRGTVLGRLAPGHEGCPARACLHWGLRRAEAYLDPLTLVGNGPVRLLPLSGEAPGAQLRGARPPAITAEQPSVEPTPSLRLRSAATPSALLALLALLAGLTLLRPRRPPSSPAGAGRTSAGATEPLRPAVEVLRPDDVVDLRHERIRRRAAG